MPETDRWLELCKVIGSVTVFTKHKQWFLQKTSSIDNKKSVATEKKNKTKQNKKYFTSGEI